MSELLYDQKTQAILLLTAYFPGSRSEAVKPLTIGEWKRFAAWLLDRSLHPGHMVTGDLQDYLKGWSDQSITPERIKRLLDRSAAFSLAMEKWARADLWIVTREDFPKRFKRRLGAAAPILVFGSGNKALLKDGGLAVVGSRAAAEQDLAYSQDIGKKAAKAGLTVVSGGARGVDEHAMLGALAENGRAIGVLADNLLRTGLSKKYREHLMENNLVLVSATSPEARWQVGHAMARNKYIYCLSDAAFVVHSEKKGGTWTGARENLNNKKWNVPLWVKRTEEKSAGNADLVGYGGKWAPENIDELDLGNLTKNKLAMKPEDEIRQVAVGEAAAPYTNKSEPFVNDGSLSAGKEVKCYDFFLIKVSELCKDTPKSRVELKDALQLKITQLDTYLKQAVEEKKLKKLQRPVRYQSNQQSRLLP